MSELQGTSRHAIETPGKVAVIDGDRRATYAELERRATALGRALDARGAGADGRVAVMLPNSLETIECMAAAARCHAAYAPVNWHLRAEELGYILRDSGAQVLVTHPDLRETAEAALEGTATQVLFAGAGGSYEAAIAEAGPEPEPFPDPWASHTWVIYTSGTTGRPKGVIHEHLASGGTAMSQQYLVDLWGYRPDDVHITSGPLYHTGPAGYASTTLFSGGTVVVLPWFDARGVDGPRGAPPGDDDVHGAGALHPHPRGARGRADPLRPLVAAPRHPRRRAVPPGRQAPDHGGHAGHGVLGAVRRLGGRGHPHLTAGVAGPTGLGRPAVAGHPGAHPAPRDPGAAGARPHGRDLDGPAVGQPLPLPRRRRKTAAAWAAGAFTVGDMGHVDDDGYLYVTDRLADMVIRGGANIYPREIEEVLYQHPAVVDCAVFGIPDERDGEHVKAVVELRPTPGRARPPRRWRRTASSTWRPTRSRRRGTSSTSSPATPTARSSSASSATRPGRARRRRSDPAADRRAYISR